MPQKTRQTPAIQRSADLLIHDLNAFEDGILDMHIRSLSENIALMTHGLWDLRQKIIEYRKALSLGVSLRTRRRRLRRREKKLSVVK